MHIHTRADIEAPQDFVFRHITDFDHFERAAMRRGARVSRVQDGGGPGTAWDIAFHFRGRDYDVRTTVTGMDPPEALRLDSLARGLTGVTRAELVPLSPRATRLSLDLEIGAAGMAGRLLLQPVKLVKGRIEERIAARVGAWAEEVGRRYAEGGGAALAGPRPS